MYIKDAITEKTKASFYQEDSSRSSTMIVIEDGHFTIELYSTPERALEIANQIRVSVQRYQLKKILDKYR